MMTFNEGTRLKVLDDRTTKTEEALVKHGDLLEQLTTKIGEIAATHVMLARENTGISQALA